MKYQIQEGRFLLPDGFADRTVNIFALGGVPSSFTFSISRDALHPGETLSEYIDRQIGMLSARLRKFKLVHRQEAVLSETQPVNGIQIDSHHQSDGRLIYQRQAAFLMKDERILVISATTQSPFDAYHNNTWSSILSTFELASDDLS
ncbi:DcrB-related protein [Pseudomonas sp.]|uniref:DcrB-related protein n=1 Tax=Pseudomonas sp. TaxID=306 RepID=UPI0003191503|nr:MULTISPECIES: DUF1795 domain-containing protein [Pseudomonas]